jgi:hypothetical protein
MDNTDNFRWPDCPPYPHADWWKITGAELGLDEAKVRFAAAMITLGGVGNKNNSAAARLAGMEISRTDAFRLARSVKVRKLVDAAEEIKTGKRRPLSEDEIDARIDKMCMSPIDRDAAIGIKLRDDRRSARLQAENREESLAESLAGLIAAVPESAVGAFLAASSVNSAGTIMGFPFLRECGPVLAKTYPAEWAAWRAKATAAGREHQWCGEFLDQMAAGPLLEGDDLAAAVGAKRARPARTAAASGADDAS